MAGPRGRGAGIGGAVGQVAAHVVGGDRIDAVIEPAVAEAEIVVEQLCEPARPYTPDVQAQAVLAVVRRGEIRRRQHDGHEGRLAIERPERRTDHQDVEVARGDGEAVGPADQRDHVAVAQEHAVGHTLDLEAPPRAPRVVVQHEEHVAQRAAANRQAP